MTKLTKKINEIAKNPFSKYTEKMYLKKYKKCISNIRKTALKS